MKKIISLFQRNYDTDHLVRNEIVPGAEWVVNGEGIATRKWDGVCTMIRDGNLYRRFEAQEDHLQGIKKLPPTWEAADAFDPITGKQQGWVLVDEVGGNKEDSYMLEALKNTFGNQHRDDGTYEFVGPKSQGNREEFKVHSLVMHGTTVLRNAPRHFHELKGYLTVFSHIEGLVWHHQDGRMVKIKGRDFGIKREAMEE